MGTSKIERLSNNHFFDGINKSDIENLDTDLFIEKEFYKGDILIKQDTHGSEMYLINSGEVLVTRQSNLEDVDLATRRANEYVGEMALFDGSLRSATVKALTDVNVYAIKTNTFLYLLNKFDIIKNNLIKTIASAIRANGIMITNERISHKELLSYKEIELIRMKDLLDQTIELKRAIDEQKSELELINKELERKNRELYKLTIFDDLTNTYSRAHLYNLLENEFSRSQRHNIDFSVLIIDIDHFKKFNDTYGHLIGDSILKDTARVISETIRKEDIIGRIGGEEFAVILPHMSLSEAHTVAEKIKSKVEENCLINNGVNLSVTISIGITDNISNVIECSKDLINQADIALYKAKNSGRNRVEVFTEGLSMAAIQA